MSGADGIVSVDVDAPTACVTGATGFVGQALVRALRDQDVGVRCTYRTQRRLRALDGLEVTPVKADVLDRRALRRALEGCDVLFHVAGIVSAGTSKNIWEINARAPALAVETAAAAGCRRVVLTSSAAAVGPSPPGRQADERQLYRNPELGLAYHNATHEGEARALAAAARTGVELITVCPTYVLGAPDIGGVDLDTSTRVVVNYMRGRLPAVTDTWTNVVDVDDVARGHVLAWSHGRPGQRYVLGGTDVRWPVLLRRLGRLAGVDRPFAILPRSVAQPARSASAMGLPSPIPLAALVFMAEDHRYSSAKAQRELGYSWRELDDTLRRSVRWFVEELEAGRFTDADRSALRLLTGGVWLADRAGLLTAAERLGVLAGRGQ
ncbi:MAG: NAD-dependent epimerase/dehydratase family protein [Solirubrobacterales bacterium]